MVVLVRSTHNRRIRNECSLVMKISSFSKLSLKSIGENEQKLASCLVKQYSWKLVKEAQRFDCLSLDLCGIENRNPFSMFEH